MAVPVAFFAVFFAYPVAAIVARGLKIDGAWQFGRVADVLAQSDVRHVLWFTTWRGAGLHRAHPAHRTARRVRLRPVRLPRQAGPAGRGDRAVRAADGRRRYGVPGAGRTRRAARRAVGRTAGHHRVGDPARARLLQLRRRRTHRRRPLVAARPAAGGGRADARRLAAEGLAAGDAARARARRGRRRADGVPVHLHVLRRRPDPRRTGLLHPGGGDLPADLADLRPVHGRRADADPVRRGGRHPRRARLDGTAAGDGPAAGGRGHDARRPRGTGRWALLAGVLVTVAVLLVLPLAVLVERSLGAPGSATTGR